MMKTWMPLALPADQTLKASLANVNTLDSLQTLSNMLLISFRLSTSQVALLVSLKKASMVLVTTSKKKMETNFMKLKPLTKVRKLSTAS